MATLADLIEARFGVAQARGGDMPADGALAAILGRRSIRRYADRPVPDELVQVLLDCAQSASAKSDLQQYSIVELRDPAKRARLSEIADMEFLGRAPVVLVFCGDLRRSRRVAELRGHHYAQDTLDSFMNATVDAALAMQSFVLAAESVGLGCCCVSHVRNDLDATAELLSLPDGVFPMCGLAAGWPGEERDVTLRLPPAVVRHVDAYDDGALKAELDGYDRRRHARFPIAPERQLHRDLYGTLDFYGWSHHAARRLSRLEGLEALRPWLERHGFGLA